MARSTYLERLVTDALDARISQNETEIQSLSGGLVYRGGYDPVSNTPNLNSGSNPGDFYTITTAGTFYGENVEVGDSLIAQVENAASLADWTILQRNVDLATEDTAGIVRFASSGFSIPGRAVESTDSRLSDLEKVDRRTITSDRSLNPNSPKFNIITSDTPSLFVNLPAAPETGKVFVIINKSASTQSFGVNGVNLAPGEIYEVIYDGTEWLEI